MAKHMKREMEVPLQGYGMKGNCPRINRVVGIGATFKQEQEGHPMIVSNINSI